MYIRNYMMEVGELTTIDIDDNLRVALNKLEKDDFLSLPVVSNEEFRGVIFKESIYRAFFDSKETNREEFLKKNKVESLCSENLRSIKANDLVENASYLLKQLRTPFLPVYDMRDRFVGIVTHSSIFKAFSEIFGIGQGTRILINIYDIPGQIARLTEVIKNENINILNFAAVDTQVLDFYYIMVRVETNDKIKINKLVRKLELSGFKVSEITY